MWNEMELLQEIEGIDETGEPKGACCVSIHRILLDGEAESIASAATMNAEISVCLTGIFAVIDLRFIDPLDYDLLQMVDTCKTYMEMVRQEWESGRAPFSLVLSVTPLGEYNSFLVGTDGFWSIMPDQVNGECNTLRFIFERERFGVYELSEDAVEDMIEEAEAELSEFGEA